VRRHDGEVIALLGLEGTESIDGLWRSIARRELAHWNRGRSDA
jgi:hypothetical protein